MSTQKERNMNVKSKPMNLRVTEAEHAMVAEMARKEGLPLATFVMWLLRKEAEKRGVSVPE